MPRSGARRQVADGRDSRRQPGAPADHAVARSAGRSHPPPKSTRLQTLTPRRRRRYPSVLPMKPPITAPTMPMRMVTKMPPGSRPGVSNLAIAPAIRPRTIQAMMLKRCPSPPRLAAAGRLLPLQLGEARGDVAGVVRPPPAARAAPAAAAPRQRPAPASGSAAARRAPGRADIRGSAAAAPCAAGQGALAGPWPGTTRRAGSRSSWSITASQPSRLPSTTGRRSMNSEIAREQGAGGDVEHGEVGVGVGGRPGAQLEHPAAEVDGERCRPPPASAGRARCRRRPGRAAGAGWRDSRGRPRPGARPAWHGRR